MGLSNDSPFDDGGIPVSVNVRNRGSHTRRDPRTIETYRIPPGGGNKRRGIARGAGSSRRDPRRRSIARSPFETADHAAPRPKGHQTRVRSRQLSPPQESKGISRRKVGRQLGRAISRPSKDGHRGLLPGKSKRSATPSTLECYKAQTILQLS